MKRISIILILGVCSQSAIAQWGRDFSIGYSYADPSGKMNHYVKQGSGIVADFHFTTPGEKFSIGADLNYTVYGFDNSRQRYEFPDGTTADMDINVANSFMNLMASGRYNLVTGKKLIPYVGAKAGYSWFRTDLNIYDPDDTDHCKPVESDILMKDGTFVYSIGGGVKYDLSSVFKNLRKEFLYINLSAYYTQGGTVDYMNTDAPAPGHSGSMATPNRQMETSFINIHTQVIHKHHVGNVYTSYAQMMDFRLSFLFRSNR